MNLKIAQNALAESEEELTSAQQQPSSAKLTTIPLSHSYTYAKIFGVRGFLWC
ncbi:MAG: hypothetical protein LUQ22_03730 [Methanotrichaceae archaeon]|nr:hypothetical protein [Methanotrichaceae archaeon]